MVGIETIAGDQDILLRARRWTVIFDAVFFAISGASIPSKCTISPTWAILKGTLPTPLARCPIFSSLILWSMALVRLSITIQHQMVYWISAPISMVSRSECALQLRSRPNEMAPYLVSVGPKALTWHRSPSDESGSCWRPPVKEGAEDEWVDVFNPNANPVVRGLVVKDIYIPDQNDPGSYVQCADLASLVNERRTTLNPDFPNTMPRGGTGRGKVMDINER